jgi:inorganic pyrophosphatase
MPYVYNLNIYWRQALLSLLLLTGCQTDYQNLPAFSEQKQLQVVVLTPAGSNQPQVYDPEKKIFIPALVAGQAAKINFLPFPGNFGFIPSTVYASGLSEPKPLEALVLAESQNPGTVQEVIPIATALLEVAGEEIPVILAVPARPSERIIAATDYADFSQNYPAAKNILQKWLAYAKPHQKVRFLQWNNETETDALIRRWLK